MGNQSEVPTKFSPRELEAMMDNFSVDRVAGECTDKGFIEFQESQWTLEDGKQHDVYCYYFSKKITNKTKHSYQGTNKYDDMEERVTPIGVLGNYIVYSIKDKEKYIKFMDYLRLHSSQQISNELKTLNFPHYVYGNAVFVDCDYVRGLTSYSLQIYPLSKFLPQKHTDTATSASQLDSSSYEKHGRKLMINNNVNEAHFYSQPASGHEALTSVPKGKIVICYETSGEFTLCEYTNDAGITTKMWILNSDLVLPTTNNSEVAQNSSTSGSNSYNELKTIWKGVYDGKNITLVFEEIENNMEVKGYSSVKGNFTLFSGTIIPNSAGYELKLQEPKDKTYAGVFSLAYNKTTQQISGKWEAYNGMKSLNLNLAHIESVQYVRVISDVAFLYQQPDYNSKVGDQLKAGNTMRFDAINKQFIHCTYHIGKERTEKSGWFLVTKVEFL